MKKSWEQMSGWIEELHAPLGNLMGQLELRQEEMEPECYGLLWRDCQNLRSYMERFAAADTGLCGRCAALLGPQSVKELRGRSHTQRRKGSAGTGNFAQGRI